MGDAVVVDGNGQLGTVASSARFKKNIKPMDKTSEAILDLKPVSFQYRSDSKGTPQFGLIAEEVAKVNHDLVVRNRNGEIYSVRYDQVNAMLLNEFLKEHRKVGKRKGRSHNWKNKSKRYCGPTESERTARHDESVPGRLELSKTQTGYGADQTVSAHTPGVKSWDIIAEMSAKPDGVGLWPSYRLARANDLNC